MFAEITPNKLPAFSAIELHNIMNKDKILEGTTYTKEKAESFSESSIFKSAMPKAEPKNDKGPIITDTAGEGFNDEFWKDLLK